jgi:hypothetical protein
LVETASTTLEGDMRLLLAIALILGATAALPDPADARKGRRGPAYYYGPGYYYGPPGNYYRQAPGLGYVPERQVCEERAFAEDPSGKYAGYPCWAREAFGRTPGR